MVFDSLQNIDEYFRNYGKQEGFGVVHSCGATIGKRSNAKDMRPPAVGMVFDSLQKIDEYFRNYGKQEGFGVVHSCGATVGKGSNAKDMRNITWTCECYKLPGRKRKKTGSTFVSDSQLCDEVLVKRKSKKVDYGVNLNATLLELQVDKKIVVVSKKGLVGTPSFVCMEKGNDSTPSTQRQGSCDPQEGEDPVIPKDPPLPKRPSHRTTDSSYKSCLEKPRKTAKTSKTTQGKKNKDSEAGLTTPSSSSMQISSQDCYLPYPQLPVVKGPYPIPICEWRRPVSPASAASRQGGFVPTLPRPRSPATPPPTPSTPQKS
uniref:Uncharacterized protein n=1 Tax=Chenopodium quinoa TaxID=63459 RepID=A0A803MCK8_CHEQI